jgi:hypothetical protein
MGVLNDQGRTICDADLTLVIKAPSGHTTTLSTQAGTVEQSGVCAGDTFVNLPDYTAHFSGTGEAGVYQMTLLAVTENGPRSIHDQFEVQVAPSFDIQRTGPTRILPTERYPVTLNIVSNQDWSGTIIETVPDSFDITPPLHSMPYDSVSVQNGIKTISWNVDLHQGQKTTIGYYFDAPDISPGFGKFLVVEENIAPGTKGGPGNPYIDIFAGVYGGVKLDRPFDVLTAKVVA